MRMQEKDLKDIMDRIQKLTKIKINPESTFQELKIDSLSLAELVFDLEEKYNVMIPDDDLKNIKKVKDIEQVFNKLLK
ncbi:acyl carrier protein [Mycoplasmopsis agalactiae]|uniref:Acyl carrier protein homolog n=2 Tax=Mycoplasmopsis agalactiae TaxID=2110 RepID=A5IZH4_MYCAP|nr:phosphopantetheine-binding protein [Mycoplasmopsis agalactiae]CAL59433.1 Acyl carrier protein homolog [Mycoplasmopsis agalactiae PG2]MCE6056766.1 acyl carrier protein [Mycoplasmopsis agalactiae]MCE6061904.1 acyl carrier protein [Mycoplasmopsis agalactiae]MCE6091141.1 acyl carrier protein [Mycoplasmopsis agalactiae]MCE6115584.1 acyl carrier protein [Mycoplasmopsis agalactiae]